MSRDEEARYRLSPIIKSKTRGLRLIKDMYVLGIHDGHNASAVLLKDGRIVAGVQEERPRGVKNAMGIPRTAIQDVLAQAGITSADVDWVALSGLHGGEYLDGLRIPQPLRSYP